MIESLTIWYILLYAAASFPLKEAVCGLGLYSEIMVVPHDPPSLAKLILSLFFYTLWFICQSAVVIRVARQSLPIQGHSLAGEPLGLLDRGAETDWASVLGRKHLPKAARPGSGPEAELWSGAASTSKELPPKDRPRAALASRGKDGRSLPA